MNEEISVDIEVDVEQQEIPTEVKSDVLKGDKGDKGEKGDPTATIEINQVITGEPGTSVIIENVGTDVNMKLDITIPRGYKGDKPLKGIDYCTEEEKQELINEILSQVNQFSVEVVSELPIEEIRDTIIYFVPKENGKQRDVYDEYIYINNDWEHIGTTEIDLSNYYNKEEIDCKVQEMNSTVQEIDNKINNLSTVYTGTNITAPTCEGFGKIKKIYGYSNQATRSGKNKFALTTIKSSSSFQVTSTGINLKSCWTNDLYTYDELVKILKPNTAYTMKAKAKVVSRPSTILSHQYGTMLLYRPGSSSLESVATPVLQMADKETITLDTEKEYITTFTTPADLTDVRFLAYSFYGNNDGSTTGSAQGEIDLTEVMLVEGTYTTETFPEYELYGVSPSPDYPSKINNVGGNINIFDGKLSQGYDSNGTIRSSNQFVCNTNLIDVKPNTQYVVSNNLNSAIVSISYYKNGTFVSFQTNIGLFTITMPADVNQIRINFYKESGLSVSDFTYIKFEEGSTATPYSPYREGSINIKTHSGNYFDLSKYIGIPCALNGTATVTDTEITIKASSNNVTYTTIGLGNTGSVIAEAYRQYCMEIPEGANKLIVNFKNNNTVRLASIYYNVLDENYTVLSEISRIYNSTDEEGILQADINVNNAKYILVRFDAAAGGDVTYKNIALGNLDKYSPYGQGSIDIKIQNEDKIQEQDMQITLAKPLYENCYLAEDGIHYTREQSVVNITSIVKLVNGNMGGVYYPPNKTSKPNNLLICSKAKFEKTYKTNTVYENSYNVVFVGEATDTLETLKQKFDGAILEYELAAEVINPYTDDISMFITQYDNKTNISNSDNAEMEIELTNNKTVSRINENAKTLQEEINNYKKSIKEELLEQKEKIESKGKWVKLATTTSTTTQTLTVESLSKFTAIALQVTVSDNENRVLQSTIGSIDQFKLNTNWQVGFVGDSTNYFVNCSYVSDTSVNMRTNSQYDRGVLWGII